MRHKLGLLRDESTPTKLFRELVDEIVSLMIFEVTADLAEEEVVIDTPLERMTGRRLAGKKLVVVPVLRAGLGMVGSVLRVIPSARVGHVGMARDEASLTPDEYYFKVPPGIEEREVLLVDPMLATGGSGAAAIRGLKERGARSIRFVCLVAAPEGVRALSRVTPRGAHLRGGPRPAAR